MTSEEYINEINTAYEKLHKLKTQGLRDMLAKHDIHENHIVSKHIQDRSIPYVRVEWYDRRKEEIFPDYREVSLDILHSEENLRVHGWVLHPKHIPEWLSIRQQDDGNIAFLCFCDTFEQATEIKNRIYNLIQPLFKYESKY